jgi:hypothetical protein
MLYPLSYEGGTCGIPCGKPAGPCRDLVGSRRVKSRGPDSSSMRPSGERQKALYLLPIREWAWLNQV